MREDWDHATEDLHRAAAGRGLRAAAGRGQGGRGAGLRRVLPVGPLPADGRRQWAARADRLLADAGRAGRADVPDPAGHPGQLGHVPLPGAAGHRGGPGRRDERRPHRAWPGRGLVRGRTRRLRDPVPAGRRAVRPAGRAAGGDHRAVGRAGGPDVLVRRGLLPGPGLARAAQAGAAAAPADHRRRARGQPDARGWPPGTRPSSTCRSPAWRRPARSTAGSARHARRSAGTQLADLFGRA